LCQCVIKLHSESGRKSLRQESKMRNIDHVIVGHSGGAGARTVEVFDPNTGQVQARVPLGTQADLAKAAQPKWAATNPQRRARVL
jgi:malonate-semialdehyde dehydrogenase (acetylating)/methylmalonate-semialdehyde dehydrogenase